MMKSRFVGWTLLAGTMVLSANGVSGQDYPNKPIRMLAAEPGGGNDMVARIIAPVLVGGFGQQVIIDNRGSLIAARTAAKAQPDGYTLLVTGNPLWLLPLMQDVPFDPVRDFSPITLAASSPNMIVVHPSLPVKSVKELIALAKAKSGALNYASGGTGSSNHLAAELFNAMAEVHILRIPFKGTGPALNALLGGQLQLMFPNAPSVTPHVKSGKLRALAVASAQPSALAPGVPTVAESGVPGYEAAAATAIFAPARTPMVIVNRLNQEIVRVLNSADVKERLFSIGVEAVGSSPEQLAAKIRSETARMGKVIKDAGIRAE